MYHYHMYYNSAATDFLEEDSCSAEVLIVQNYKAEKLLRPQNLTKGMVMKTLIMITICSFFSLKRLLILKFVFDVCL